MAWPLASFWEMGGNAGRILLYGQPKTWTEILGELENGALEEYVEVLENTNEQTIPWEWTMLRGPTEVSHTEDKGRAKTGRDKAWRNL